MDPTKREAWDSVLSKDAMTCLRKFYYLHVEGWRPRKLSIHLAFGLHYATALEHYHKLRAGGASQDDALLDVIREAMIATWDRDTGPWVTDDTAKTRETLIRTIIWYVDQFGDDDRMSVVQRPEGPAVEYSFTFELTDSLLYCGHIDRLVEYEGDLFVQDQKTTKSTLSPSYFTQWEYPEPQMTGYSMAGQIILGAPVRGVIIDAAQVAVGFSRFERGFTFRTKEQLLEWRDTLLYHISLAHSGDFPMNSSSCDKFGGCVFRSVCSRPQALRDNFLRADFEQGPLWNPLEKR